MADRKVTSPGGPSSEPDWRRHADPYRTLAENLPGMVYRIDLREKQRMTFLQRISLRK